MKSCKKIAEAFFTITFRKWKCFLETEAIGVTLRGHLDALAKLLWF